MHNGDVLGDEGRKALNACVKVKIKGKPETRRYDRKTALERLYNCYANPFGLFGDFSSYAFEARMEILHELLLPTADKSEKFSQDYPVRNRTYNIVDIHDALVNFDERSYVEKYPREGPGSDKLRNLIEKRRADVEREYEEAKADPDRRCRYSWLVAQRRVRDCFAGNFPTDELTLSVLYERSRRQGHLKTFNITYSICDIHEAFVYWDERRQRAEKQRASIEKVYAEANAAVAAETNIEHTLCKCSGYAAASFVRSCIPYEFLDEERVPVIMDEKGNLASLSPIACVYCIFEIHKAVIQFHGKELLKKYPEKGPGSEELRKSIDDHRNNLEEEYEKATCYTGSKPILREYSWSEAERRVRDCFAGTFLGDAEIFSTVEKDESYDIFDIKQAVHNFDEITLGKVCKYKEKPIGDENQKVDEQRASIQREYDEATRNTDIEYGSGFIVHDHFIITNRHVVESYLDKPQSHEIWITNAAIGDHGLACEVAHYDAGKELALLYCPDLNLKQSGICPLQLSSQSLLPGMSIFSFGYPISHTGETALFVSGNVSGSREMLAGHSMVVLNCSLNSGNSGGPVMCWVNGQLRVVGIATQKHFKKILSLPERETIEKIRELFQTFAIPDLTDWAIERLYLLTESYVSAHLQTPLFLLTLKLYDALETHSQFNLSNALPGHLVVKFIKGSVSNFTGEHKEELEETVKLSEDTDLSNEH